MRTRAVDFLKILVDARPGRRYSLNTGADEPGERPTMTSQAAGTPIDTWFIVVCPADFERLDGVMPGVRAHILGGGETRDAAMSSAARRAGAWLSGVRVVPWADEDRPESGVCYRDAAGQPWHGGSLRRKADDVTGRWVYVLAGDDSDYGVIRRVDGDRAEVAWSTEVVTWIDRAEIVLCADRAEAEAAVDEAGDGF